MVAARPVGLALDGPSGDGASPPAVAVCELPLERLPPGERCEAACRWLRSGAWHLIGFGRWSGVASELAAAWWRGDDLCDIRGGCSRRVV